MKRGRKPGTKGYPVKLKGVTHNGRQASLAEYAQRGGGRLVARPYYVHSFPCGCMVWWLEEQGFGKVTAEHELGFVPADHAKVALELLRRRGLEVVFKEMLGGSFGYNLGIRVLLVVPDENARDYFKGMRTVDTAYTELLF